ncbi:hypothetical protein [Pseudomonas sp. dw_358]|nr:hypothetical protein [Pseudomonas sp. dw_358]
MHEIPNFPFPSLHEPEQTPAQSSREQQVDSEQGDPTQPHHADRKDQAR